MNTKNKIKEALKVSQELNFIKANLSEGQLSLIVATYDDNSKKLKGFNFKFYRDNKLGLSTDGKVFIGAVKPEVVNGKRMGKDKIFVHNPIYPLPTSKYGKEFNLYAKQELDRVDPTSLPRYKAFMLAIKHIDTLKAEYQYALDNPTGDLKRFLEQDKNKQKKEKENVEMKKETTNNLLDFILLNKKRMIIAHKLRKAANLELDYHSQMRIFLKVDWMLWKHAVAGDLNVEAIESFIFNEFNVELDITNLLGFKAAAKKTKVVKPPKKNVVDKKDNPSLDKEDNSSLNKEDSDPVDTTPPSAEEPKHSAIMELVFDAEEGRINYVTKGKSGFIPLKLKATDGRGREMELFSVLNKISIGKPYPKGTVMYVPANTYAEVVRHKDFKIRIAAAGYVVKLKTA